jgi:hypothetical protein
VCLLLFHINACLGQDYDIILSIFRYGYRYILFTVLVFDPDKNVRTDSMERE